MKDYNVEYLEHPNFLEVSCKGKIEGVFNMMTYSGAVIQKAVEKSYTKVLIDESQVSIYLSDYDQHELMNFFLNDFPKSITLRFSVIYADKNKEVAKFFEDLSSRVGFDCKFFLTKEEAMLNLAIE